MKSDFSMSPELKAIFPFNQFIVERQSNWPHADRIEYLESQLLKCPKLGETDGMREHPAIFHYFFHTTDIFICEYSPKRKMMFGFAIMGGDIANSEFGYFAPSDFLVIPMINIDYFFEEKSIEAARHKLYPHYFNKPPSLEGEEPIGKNDRLPDNYRDFPYQYTRTKYGTILRKNNDEVFLQDDDETEFFQDCNRAKQKGRCISDVIDDYFIN